MAGEERSFSMHKSSRDDARELKRKAAPSGILNVLVGLACLGIGGLGYLLVGWGAYRARSLHDPEVLAFLAGVGAIASAFLWFGVAAIRFAARCFSGDVTLKEISPLAAEIMEGRFVHRNPSYGLLTPILIIGVVFAAPFALMSTETPKLRITALVIVALCVILAVFPGFRILRARKFGESVCRLKARPTHGMALEAEIEVECPGPRTGLPDRPTGPVEVELRSVTLYGRGSTRINWTSRSITPADGVTQPGDGTMRIPVSVPVPAMTGQRIEPATHLRLRLKAPCRGISYGSDFVIPFPLSDQAR